MITVESLDDALEFEVGFRIIVPGEGEKIIEIGGLNTVVGGIGWEALKFTELLFKVAGCLLIPVLLLRTFAEILDIISVGFTEFVADHGHLLPQEILAGVAVKILLNLGMNIRAKNHPLLAKHHGGD